MKLVHHLQQEKRLLVYLNLKKIPLTGISIISENEIDELEKKYSDSFIVLDNLYSYAHFYYSIINRDEPKGISYLNKGFKLYSKQQHIDLYPKRYLMLLYGEAMFQLAKKAYKEVEVLLEKVKKFNSDNSYLQSLQKFYYIALSIQYFEQTKQFEAGLNFIKNIGIDSIEQEIGFYNVKKKQLYWRMSVCCFYAKDYKRCKNILNHILHLDQGTAVVLKDMSAFAEFLKMIVAYEECDFDYIKQQSKMLLKLLEKQNILFPLEKAILYFFKEHASKFNSKHEKNISFFKNLQQTTQAISKQDVVKGMYLRFDFIAWIDSKIKM